MRVFLLSFLMVGSLYAGNFFETADALLRQIADRSRWHQLPEGVRAMPHVPGSTPAFRIDEAIGTARTHAECSTQWPFLLFQTPKLGCARQGRIVVTPLEFYDGLTWSEIPGTKSEGEGNAYSHLAEPSRIVWGREAFAMPAGSGIQIHHDLAWRFLDLGHPRDEIELRQDGDGFLAFVPGKKAVRWRPSGVETIPLDADVKEVYGLANGEPWIHRQGDRSRALAMDRQHGLWLEEAGELWRLVEGERSFIDVAIGAAASVIAGDEAVFIQDAEQVMRRWQSGELTREFVLPNDWGLIGIGPEGWLLASHPNGLSPAAHWLVRGGTRMSAIKQPPIVEPPIVEPARRPKNEGKRPMLGVVFATGEPYRLATPDHPVVGVSIRRVVPNGPASRAGVRSGDILLAIDMRAMLLASQVNASIATKNVGQTVSLLLARGRSPRLGLARYAILNVELSLGEANTPLSYRDPAVEFRRRLAGVDLSSLPAVVGRWSVRGGTRKIGSVDFSGILESAGWRS